MAELATAHPGEAVAVLAILLSVVYLLVMRYGDDEARFTTLFGAVPTWGVGVLAAVAFAVMLATTTVRADVIDSVIPEPMCLYYILFGIPIPSGECLCLITGWC